MVLKMFVFKHLQTSNPALACSSTRPSTLYSLPLCLSVPILTTTQAGVVNQAPYLLSLLGSESLLLTVQCFLSGSEQPCFSLPCFSGLITRDPYLGFHLRSYASPETLGRADRKCLLPHIPALSFTAAIWPMSLWLPIRPDTLLVSIFSQRKAQAWRKLASTGGSIWKKQGPAQCPPLPSDMYVTPNGVRMRPEGGRYRKAEGEAALCTKTWVAELMGLRRLLGHLPHL